MFANLLIVMVTVAGIISTIAVAMLLVVAICGGVLRVIQTNGKIR